MKRKNKAVVTFGDDNDADYRIMNIADKHYATEFALRHAQHIYGSAFRYAARFRHTILRPLLFYCSTTDIPRMKSSRH
jgi:hypothetical protein